MSYKAITKTSYEATANAFTRNVADLAPITSIERFIKLLPSNAKIVDIGCGSGRDAKIFTENGVSVFGLDFCKNLIDIARSNAPLAEFQQLDIEEINFPAAYLDGAWACCSLSHISKATLPFVLLNIHSFLKEQGYFYLTLRKGSGEGLEKDTRYQGDFEKFWASFEEKEIESIIQKAKFKVLECCTVHKEATYRTFPCIRMFCQKQ